MTRILILHVFFFFNFINSFIFKNKIQCIQKKIQMICGK